MNVLTNDEKARLILSVGKGGGGGRRLLSPVEIAELLERCVREGSTSKELAAALTIGPDMVGRFLALLKLPASVRSAVEFSGSRTTLSFSVAHQISRLEGSALQEELAKACIAFDLSWREASQVVQRHNRSGESVESSIESVLALRPVIERRHVVMGSIMSSDVCGAIRTTSPQEKRDAWGMGALAGLFSGITEFAIRITPDRFTLSGNEAFYRALSALGSDFETIINARFLEHLDEL